MSKTKLFPVTVVGSWPRPAWLVQALRKRQNGEITQAEFNQIADDAVLASIKYQEDAGVDIVADGEVRRDNFYSFVTEKLSGIKFWCHTVCQLAHAIPPPVRPFRLGSALTVSGSNLEGLLYFSGEMKESYPMMTKTVNRPLAITFTIIFALLAVAFGQRRNQQQQGQAQPG